MDRLYYRKSQRISSEKDFARVLSTRQVVRRGALCLYAAVNDLSYPRFGISVSKSSGQAVQRNRLKRLAREVFRRHQYEFQHGVDYILIFSLQKAKTKKNREEPAAISYKELEATVLEMARVLEKRLS